MIQKRIKINIVVLLVILISIPFSYAETLVYDHSPNTISYSYDSNNRILTISSDSENIYYSYDLDMNNTLSNVGNNEVMIRYEYDDRLRIKKETKIIDGISFEKQIVYDSMDRPVLIEINDEDIRYSYNKQRKIREIDNFVNNNYYDAKGNIVNSTYYNNILTSFTYEPKTLRLNSIISSSIISLNYTYDLAGNIIKIKNNLNDKDTNLEYDDLYRLVSANRTNDFSILYSYNSIGNLINISDGSRIVSFAYGQSPVHAPYQINKEFLDVNKFYIKNSLGENIAWIGDEGNIMLKSKLFQDSNHQRSEDFAFVIRNDGEDVLIIEDNGTMYIDGTIFENQNNLNSLDENNDFRIMKRGSLMGFVNETGHIFLKGTVIEEGYP